MKAQALVHGLNNDLSAKFGESEKQTIGKLRWRKAA